MEYFSFYPLLLISVCEGQVLFMLLVIQKGSREAGLEKVGRGNERAVYVYEERKKEEEIKGGGRGGEWGWVNSEVRSSSLHRRHRPRLPGFLMSTAAETERKCLSVTDELMSHSKINRFL